MNSPDLGKSDSFQTEIQLTPFSYHRKLRDHFKSRSKTWNWFKEETKKAEQVAEFKKNLLKNTYRLDSQAYGNLYKISEEICQTLAIDAEVTLYQENNSDQLNAGISVIDREAHIVISGNLINLLNEDEMRALLSHELSHYLFYKIDGGEFEITQRIVLALANDPRSEDAIIETARLFQLYLELFCDAGSLKVCKDHHLVIQMLVKLNTGLSQVNAESYLTQAEEILKTDDAATLQMSHPESYIRSLALKLRATQHPDYVAEVKKLIEGELDLNRLDLFNQVEMSELTRQLLHVLLKPKWMNTSSVRNLCDQYFKDFNLNAEAVAVPDLAKKIEPTKDSVKNYLCYVMLDMAKVDADMELVPMGFAMELAELLGLSEEFERVVRKEMKMTVREFKLMKADAMSDLQKMQESKEDSIYNG